MIRPKPCTSDEMTEGRTLKATNQAPSSHAQVVGLLRLGNYLLGSVLAVGAARPLLELFVDLLADLFVVAGVLFLTIFLTFVLFLLVLLLIVDGLQVQLVKLFLESSQVYILDHGRGPSDSLLLLTLALLHSFSNL